MNEIALREEESAVPLFPLTLRQPLGRASVGMVRSFIDKLYVPTQKQAHIEKLGVNLTQGLCYCGGAMFYLKGGCWHQYKNVKLQWDHYLAASNGFLSAKGNLFPACFDCNNAKSDKTPEEFAAWIFRPGAPVNPRWGTPEEFLSFFGDIQEKHFFSAFPTLRTLLGADQNDEIFFMETVLGIYKSLRADGVIVIGGARDWLPTSEEVAETITAAENENVTIKEQAARLDIASSTLSKWCKNNNISWIHPIKKWTPTIEEIEEIRRNAPQENITLIAQARALGITPPTLGKWCKSNAVKWKSQKGSPLPVAPNHNILISKISEAVSYAPNGMPYKSESRRAASLLAVKHQLKNFPEITGADEEIFTALNVLTNKNNATCFCDTKRGFAALYRLGGHEDIAVVFEKITRRNINNILPLYSKNSITLF